MEEKSKQTPDILAFALQQSDSDDSSAGEDIEEQRNSVEETIVASKFKALNTEIPPDTRLGNYIIRELIGQGGMGVVYKGYDPLLNRVVAIKTIFADNIEKQARRISRFYEEIQVSAKLNHPNIVKVYNGGVWQEHLYLVMEYVEGISLSEYLEQKISRRRKLEVLVQVAEALHHAHTQAIVHRDVKPSNILITKDHKAIVMDFGIAKMLGKGKGITQTGEIVGTLKYMAPEQLKPDSNRRIDATTDIYALGAILYEIVTKRPMIQVRNILEIANYVPRPISHFARNISRSLEMIWEKSTAREQTQRYQSAATFAEDLREYLQQPFYRQAQPFFSMRQVVLFVVLLALLGIYWQPSLQQRATNKKLEVKLQAQDYLKYAQSLVAQEDYEQAYTQLKAAITSDGASDIKDKISQELIVVYSKLKKHSEALALYQSFPDKIPHRIYIPVVETLYYQNRYQELKQFACDILQSNTTTEEQKGYVLYYIGALQYERQQYEKCAVTLQETEKLIKNQNFFEHYATLLMRLGKSFYYIKNFVEARKYLEQAQQFLPDVAKVRLYLARSYLDDSEIDPIVKANKAIIHLEKCLELQPNNSEYMVLKGQCHSILRDYRQAAVFFQKALQVDPTDSNALENLTKITLLRSVSQENMENMLILYFFHLGKSPTPCLFLNTFYEIQRQYQRAYYDLHTHRSKKISPQVFIEKLQGDISEQVYESVTQGLLVLRYHPEIESLLLKTADDNPENKDKILKILYVIRQNKTRQAKFALYYCLATAFLQNNTAILKPYSTKNYLEILLDSQEQIEIRYLAARALHNNLEVLEEGAQEQQRPLLASLCRRVLYESGFYKSDSEILQHAYQKTQSVFWRAMLAETAQTEKWITFFLQQPEEFTRIHAASKAIMHKSLHNDAEKILRPLLQHSNASIALYANHYYWQKHSYNEQDVALFFEILQNANEQIQRRLLRHIRNRNFRNYSTKFEHLLYANDMQLRLIAISTISRWHPFHRELEKIIYNDDENILVRIVSLIFSFANGTNGEQRNRQLSLQKLLGLRSWFKSNITNKSFDKYIKIVMYYMLFSTIENPIEYLALEKDTDLQRTILLAFLLQDISYSRLFPGKNFSSMHIRETIEQYFCHKSPEIRRSAYCVNYFLREQKERESLFQEMQNSSNEIAREGVALGRFLHFRRELRDKNVPTSRFQLLFSEMNQLAILAQDEEKRQQFLETITSIIELNPQAEYFYSRAILHKAQKNYLLAQRDLYSAIAHNSPFGNLPFTRYVIELLHTLWIQNKKTEAQQLLQKFPLLGMENDRITLWRMRETLVPMGELEEIQEAFKNFCYEGEVENCYLQTGDFFPQDLLQKINTPHMDLARMFAHLQDTPSTIRHLQYSAQHISLTQEMILRYPEMQFIRDHAWVKTLQKE